MDILLVAIPIMIIFALIVVVIVNLKRKSKFNGNDARITIDKSALTTSEPLDVKREQGGGLTIPIERLPDTIHFEDESLFEITDHKVIARISETIPAAAEALAKAITNKAQKNVELYKVVIPSGATLARSKDMEGAVRGLYRGAKNIKGHANLVKVDPSKISKVSSMANGVANVMNVGSLVVGQYYMAEINTKIETLSKSVDKISDFQEREFKSRIISLIALVGKISSFSSEILERSDLRNRKLHTLDDLEREGSQLLQQINIAIVEGIKKNQKPDFKEYQETVDDFRLLLEYQQTLLTVLGEISKLTYLLGKGENSNEMCYSIFNSYLEQSNQVRATLEEWHLKQVEAHGIDLNMNRRSKKGIEGLFSKIPGLWDNKHRYKELKDGIGQKIDAQTTKSQIVINKPEEIFEKDVQIIIKNGNYYYLHEAIERSLYA